MSRPFLQCPHTHGTVRENGNEESFGVENSVDVFGTLWSRRVGLNHRPTVYETVALPLSYAGSRQERQTLGIESNRQPYCEALQLGSFIPFVGWYRQLKMSYLEM